MTCEKYKHIISKIMQKGSTSGGEDNKDNNQETFQNRQSLNSRASQITVDWQIYLQESRIIFNDRINKYFCNRDNSTLRDFKYYNHLGNGNYGEVVAVINQNTNRSYAMKILSIQKIIKTKQVRHTHNEKKVMQSVSFPFLIQLKYFFKDQFNIYFVITLGTRGELFEILRDMKTFNDEICRFYGSQVVLALEYLHFLNIAYRDIKPENIVVCQNGYIKLTDFGFAKILDRGRTYSFCGTPEYMAPEIIQQKAYGKAVDWWAVGILIYEMLIGNSPFKSNSMGQTYAKILSTPVRFPRRFNAQAKDLITKLLERDLTRRWGNLKGGVNDIKGHGWFQEIDWMKLLNQKIKPPHLPPVVIPNVKTPSTLHTVKPM